MIKHTASAIALAFVLTACGQNNQAPTAAEIEQPAVTAEQIAANSERINAWFDEKYEESLQFSPMGLTFLGRKDKYDEIDCFTIECMQEQLDWRVAATKEMEEMFDYDALSPADKISYDIWKYQTDQAVAGKEFVYNGYVFDQMNGPQGFMPTFMINFHRVDTAEDMQAYISRLKGIGRAMNQAIDIAKESASRGVHAPKFAYEGVIDQSQKVITGAPFTEGEDSAIYADAKGKIAALVETGEVSEEDGEAMLEDVETALLDDFKPAYENIIAFAEEDMANSPDPDSPVGANTQPNGEAYYNHLLSTQTTTDMTADQIHQIGLEEVERIHAEMESIKDQVGFEGSLQDFFKMLRDSKDDERFYYPNTDEGRQAYIDDATAVIDNIKVHLPEFFGILPKADLTVKRVEPFREQDGAAQHYYPGTPDGSRPGIYYAHLSDMTAMPKRELEVIAYHEGIPGHHMQISIAQELTGVPQFRTQAGFTAYVEGWALYSEWLAQEFPDTYQDPYSNFGRLGSEIWRAIRLVVDTGIHSKGWTEEEAVQYFLDNAAITETQARSEIQRYIVMPGQATSYKIGMMKIQKLRQKAEGELGDKFDIRAFHDTVLGGGALPLQVLERRVDQWIEEVKAS
ncbi:DUF885 domain-containing protein [Hyphomonas pacifica]|uniref:DUF885 domain-containing protein n=1 Tax=Hyphomonas pacifica TaxID=1280941 RepID=UPI000DBFE536|nr:DUF885 domain-containing protein [Hyphomonas pacifica]RAN36869.1 hypothetical protein HY11_11550 [Hyphomonas pacifica]